MVLISWISTAIYFTTCKTKYVPKTILQVTIKQFTTCKYSRKVAILDILINKALKRDREKIEVKTLDTRSAEIRTYKPSAIKFFFELKDNTNYIIIGLYRHPFRTGFKYVLKIREDTPDSSPRIYKSSYFMDQILNVLELDNYNYKPYLYFKATTSRTTPKNTKAKFIAMEIDDKYKIDPADEADAAASSSTT